MIAIVQNDPEVPAGSILDLIADFSLPFSVIPAYAEKALPDPATLSAAVILGGAMGVHEEARYPYLGAVRSFMEQALRLRVPLLGICLGGQLLTDVLGGKVTAASPHGEKGICQVELTAAGEADPLFAGVPTTFTTFQWHDDSFLPPAEATLLARSGVCPWQAFRYDRSVGVQFHPEVNRDIVSTWCAHSDETEKYLAAFHSQRALFDLHSRTILANFIRETPHGIHP